MRAAVLLADLRGNRFDARRGAPGENDREALLREEDIVAVVNS